VILGLNFTDLSKYLIMKKRIQKMNKYNSEDYFTVRERRTHKKICDCAEYSDAMMMFDIDPHNRQITRNKFLMGQVVDVEIPKALPTNEIAIDTKEYQDHQNQWMVDKINQLPQIKLPEGQGEPVIV
jgi:hypothetical protein